MSYTRTAIATATIVISLSAALPGTQPAAASGGLAGSAPQEDWASSHRPALQVPAVEAVAAATAPLTTITADTAEQHEIATWALEQMAAAGLALPPVTIYMHTDRIDCSANPERLLNGYHTEVDGQHVVHSCGNQWTLLHELGHVWDDYQLDDDARREILDHQGLDEWHAPIWQESGAEHIASVIAWAIDGARPSRIGYYSDAHLAAAYELATGLSLPDSNDATPAAQADSTPTGVTASLPEPELI